MIVNIFILCFNESILLQHTIKHYKTRFRNCKITIYDNESTDNSVEIAKSLDCNVISFNTKGINDIRIKANISNNCWKDVTEGWIIMIDMDEWLMITEEDLIKEEQNGTTILSTIGYQMFGESKEIDLSDIDLHSINKGMFFPGESKHLCFLREHIAEMNYSYGCHKCKPTGKQIGNIKYSSNKYINKHMCYLGLPFLTNKMIKRYERCAEMRKIGRSTHYTDNINKINKDYNDVGTKSKIIISLG
jgi:glycosyltransferase involved in cell wall biosynthesis